MYTLLLLLVSARYNIIGMIAYMRSDQGHFHALLYTGFFHTTLHSPNMLSQSIWVRVLWFIDTLQVNYIINLILLLIVHIFKNAG